MARDISTRLGSLSLRNPLVLASGFIGSDESLLRRAWEAGFGAVTTKSLTPKPRKGYDPPIVVDLGYGYLNAVGLANPGIEYLPRLLSLLPQEAVVILSIAGATPQDFRHCAEVGVENNVDAIELNLSCPHVKGLGMDIVEDVGYSLDIIEEVVSLGRPVYVKLGLTDTYMELVARSLDRGVEGFTVMNTVKGLAIDIESGWPILTNVYGGLSGPAIHPIALRMVHEIYGEYRVPIIGTGGVTGWREAVAMLYAGASAVGIGSYLFNRRVESIGDILKGIQQHMERKGFKDIASMVGYSHRR